MHANYAKLDHDKKLEERLAEKLDKIQARRLKVKEQLAEASKGKSCSLIKFTQIINLNYLKLGYKYTQNL